MAGGILDQFARLTGFLGLALGPDYEVALHDLTDKHCSIIAIANSHVSGRTVGAPLTNVALQILKDGSYRHSDYLVHYPGLSREGKPLRSSTFFLKEEGELVGMLCINFDDSRYRAVSQAVLQLCQAAGLEGPEEAPASQIPERFHNSIQGVAGEAVAQALAGLGREAGQLTPDQRQQLVSALEPQGIFLLKGAVKEVAQALGCSQATVYRYLSQARREEEL